MLIHMPNLSLEEIFILKSAHSEEEWKAAVNRIKIAREGQLPPDWDSTIISTGIHARVSEKFSQIFLTDYALPSVGLVLKSN